MLAAELLLSKIVFNLIFNHISVRFVPNWWLNRICRKEQASFMNRQNHSESENRLTPEEQQEFLELLARLSSE